MPALTKASSQLQIVGIIILHILTHPQDDTAKHDQAIRQHIRDAHVDCLHGVVLEEILQGHDGGTASEAAGHEGKAEEQYGAGLPCNSIPTIREAVGGEAGFLDAVDHQHSQRGADERDPVHKVDVDVRAVVPRFRKDAGIDEKEEAQRELWQVKD